jgi:capsular exopolysaccharide synthesis family protein
VGRALSSEAMADRRVLDDGVGRYTAPDIPPDDPVEVGRYLDAFRRSKWLIALIVISLTGAVLLISLLMPKTYRATATLVREQSPQSSSDAESTQRDLATVRVLLTTRRLLRAAVRSGGLEGETADSLRDKVHATVDQDANVISIVATDDTARGAAAIANVVAATYLADERRTERQRLNRARALLRQELADLQASLTPLNQAELSGQIADVRQRLTDLNVSAATGRSSLELAEAAEPPSAPSSPRPVRNALFALFASLFVAALVVLARAQLRPRVSGSRELSRLLDLPVMVEVPFVRRRFGHSPNTLSGVEYEAYQTLQAALRMQLPPDGKRTVLVTSALHGEGKTEVTAALGLVLAQAGQRTWLVSADMRWPRLHEIFDVAQTPGLAEVLAGDPQGEGAVAVGSLKKGSRENGGRLHVLASGQKPPDPAQLLAGGALDGFFDEIKESEYDYVLLDGPPLLGLVDSQVLAQRVDGVIVVCRPDRLTSENAIDMRELLQRLRAPALGIVIIGGRGSPVSYFEG